MLNEIELNSIIKNAQEKSEIARLAIEESLAFTWQIKADQDVILAKNKILSEDTDIDMRTLSSRLTQDRAIASSLTENLKPYRAGVQVSWALKTHKMEEILAGVDILFSDESYAYGLSSGKLPSAYDNTVGYDQIPIMGYRDSTIYGNSKCSYLSAGIIEAHLNLLGKSAGISDIDLLGYPTPWFDQAAIAHFDYLPLDASIPNFDNFSFGYHDSQQAGLVYVHSGYAFGGPRPALEISYPAKEKTFLPHDCSSWSANIVASPFSYSTFHLLQAHNHQKNIGFLSPDEQLRDEVNQISDKLEVVDIHGLEDVQPGMFMCFRRFNEKSTFENSLGTGGHVVMALGTNGRDEVVTLGYNRDMPNIEGFGIQTFPIINDETRRTIFFQARSELSISKLRMSQKIAYNCDIRSRYLNEKQPFFS